MAVLDSCPLARIGRSVDGQVVDWPVLGEVEAAGVDGAPGGIPWAEALGLALAALKWKHFEAFVKID